MDKKELLDRLVKIRRSLEGIPLIAGIEPDEAAKADALIDQTLTMLQNTINRMRVGQ